MVPTRGKILAAALLTLGLPPARSVGSEAALSDPAAVDAVARSIQHHGGPHFRASRTRLTQTSRSGSFIMSVERDGGRFRYEVTGSTSDGGARRVVVTNENVAEWVDSAAQPLNAAKRARLRRFVDARVWFPFLPYGLSGSDAHLADGGIEPWNGVDLQRVKVTFAEGSSADADNEYVVWIEPETGRMLYYAYSFDTANDRVGLRFRPLSNFRRVGGLLFYDAENLGFEGGADTSVDRINPEFVSERMEAVSSIAVTEIEAQPIAP